MWSYFIVTFFMKYLCNIHKCGQERHHCNCDTVTYIGSYLSLRIGVDCLKKKKEEKQYLILINMLTFSQKLEWQTLSMVRGLSDQMRAACFNVVSSAQGLPSTVQQQLTSARNSAEELYSSLGSSSSFTPVLVERSRHQLTQVISALPILSASFKA